MTELTTKKNFDYSVVDKETKSKLIYYASQIQKQGAIHVESGIEIGRMLSEARELCGESFRDWVERECQYSVRSAYNYISAWENFGSCANFAHIELSAMYELTKNKSAKKAALEMAKRGKKVTREIAKELVAKHSETSSDKGKPGGAGTSSSEPPVADATASDATAAESSARVTEPEEGDADSRRQAGTPPYPADESCPVCASNKWVDGKCKKCSHVQGEPAGEPDEDHIKTQRSKTVKTAEALLRAFDDLNLVCPNRNHAEAIRLTKAALKIGREWK